MGKTPAWMLILVSVVTDRIKLAASVRSKRLASSTRITFRGDAWGMEGICFIFIVLFGFLIFWESCLNGNVVNDCVIRGIGRINSVNCDRVLPGPERRQHQPIAIGY